MNKLWLIIKREYLTRVKKKSFILVTLLTPLSLGLIIFVSAYFTMQADKIEKNIIISDKSGALSEHPLESKYLTFSYTDKDVSDVEQSYIDDGYDIFVDIPSINDWAQKDYEVSYYAKDKLSLTTIESLERKISSSIRAYKIDKSTLDRDELKSLETSVTFENALALKEGDTDIKGDTSSKMQSGIAMGLSYLMAFMMYMVIFVFGSMVMRSVMEEKINRIVEVIISSVKPFQLMLGKLMGVGLVGLTQLSIWILLIPLIMAGVGMFFGGGMEANSAQIDQATELAKDMGSEFSIPNLISEFNAFNWWLIIPSFVVFFLGGFFIYSSLYAAVGSMISEDMGEANQFMLPIMVPVILGIIMIPYVMSNPDGVLSVAASMFPLTSPIVMPARLPYEPALWQLLLSIIILLAAIIFFVWLSGRIYRVGIFMYGKKISFKEVGKWLTYKS